jgi:8-oxo-dGTP diphosphatase
MPKNKHKIATLVFIENSDGDQLLIERNQEPNLGMWTPIGGKLETEIGESPHECAARETFEEAGFKVDERDLHLFATVAEKSYPGSCHWLLFLFHCKKAIPNLPDPISEGRFAFHAPETIANLSIPPSDRSILWPVYQERRNGFSSISIDYALASQEQPYRLRMEQIG